MNQRPNNSLSLSDNDSFYSPSDDFAQQARVSSMTQYRQMHEMSLQKPELFWGAEARELHWFTPWNQLLNWESPHAQWFTEAKTNLAFNCLDRHLEAGLGEKAAILWEGEPGDTRAISYKELHQEVCKLANVLQSSGIGAESRVIIYMPMIPEATVAMLACARIGAVHSVVFGGFSADSIRDRIEDSGAELVITADTGWRRGKTVPLKENVDKAISSNSQIKKVIVYQRTNTPVSMQAGRDTWWHDEMASAPGQHEAAKLDAEHPLFILYTSGSTGKPKGILHTTAGYMVGTYTTCKYVFDLRKDDVYWCTADVGWITGHSYITYGPLLNGVTQVMYEGAPNYPDFSRFWSIVETYKVSIFYTAPTAIRAFIKAGDEFIKDHDLSSLRLLGTVGEPINPAAWHWYYETIGNSRCPIVDTWWQTETGAIMIAPLPGATPIRPGTATQPFFGIDAAVLDENGNPCPPGVAGKLVIQKPWPSMLRTIYGDDDRYRDTYWSDYPGKYTTGDGAIMDEHGNISIVGRLDDVLNVSGHRLGTAEIESALVAHPLVAEAAVIGAPHELKGEAIVCFVTLKAAESQSPSLSSELREHVGQSIGAIAKPDQIYFTSGLPKTRSGKIMRRLLKELVNTGEITGNLSTIEDPHVLEELKATVLGVSS